MNMMVRHQHRVGEKILAGFVEAKDSYVIDTGNGEAIPVRLFLAVLGASGYAYAESVSSQDADSWITGHIHAFELFGGTTKTLIPVLAAEFSYLACHVRYHELARRCCMRIEDTNSKAFLGREKRLTVFAVAAKWFSLSLSQRIFYEPSELESAVLELLNRLNDSAFKKLPGSRREWFEKTECPFLNPVPAMSGDQEFWLQATVSTTHINIDKHYYSVPQSLVGQQIDLKVTPEFVEIFFNGRQVTLHKRQNLPGRSTTKTGHTASPKANSNWSATRVLKWAEKIGPAATYLTKTILEHGKYSDAGIRSCLGLLTLESQYGRERLESACRQSATLKSWTVASVRSMLAQGLDQTPIQLTIPDLVLPSKSKTQRKRKIR